MIARYRMSRSMTQEDLARLMGVSRATVAMWETGRSQPRTAMLLSLARILGCTVEDLLREDDENDAGGNKGE